jgi:hypothetical protein
MIIKPEDKKIESFGFATLGEQGDIMAAMVIDQNDMRLIRLRIRMYVDDRIFDSEDEKKFYELKPKLEGFEACKVEFESMMHGAQEALGYKGYLIDVSHPCLEPDGLFDFLSEKPYTHFKTAKIETPSSPVNNEFKN